MSVLTTMLILILRWYVYFKKNFVVVDGQHAFILFIFLYVVLRIEPSASHMLGKRSTTEPWLQPNMHTWASKNDLKIYLWLLILIWYPYYDISNWYYNCLLKLMYYLYYRKYNKYNNCPEVLILLHYP